MATLPSIYVKDTAHATILEAADFLADRLAESSGQTAPSVIAVANESLIPDRAIIVGFAPENFTTAYEAEVIDIQKNRLHIYGLDEFDPDNPDLFDGNYDPDYPAWSSRGGWQYAEENWMRKAGTYNAVMRFLTKYIGHIRAFPGDLGRVTPSHQRMVIPVGKDVYYPHARFRNFLRYSQPTRSGNSGQGRQFLKENGCFFSGFGDVAHGWSGYFDKYHPDGDPGGDRSELFALQPDNSRGFPLNNQAKICVGEPDTDDVWLTDTAQFLIENNPLYKVAGCGMQDSHSNGHCIDPRSLAMDYNGPDAIPFQWTGSGASVQGVALADRHVAHANRINTKFRVEYSDQTDFMIGTNAYGPSRPAPKGVTMDTGVYCVNVANCMNDWQSDGGQYHRTNMAEWCLGDQKNFWRPNIGQGHGHQRGGFLTQIHGVREMLDDWGTNCIGVCPDFLWENWSNAWPMYYVLARWHVDPGKPVDEVMDDAYQKLFPLSHAQIKSHYERTEAKIESLAVHNATYGQLEGLWDDQFFTDAQADIDAAKALVSDPSDELTRINWVEEGLRWWQDLMQCIKWMNIKSYPYELLDGVELATAANAIEEDTDGITGWQSIVGQIISQSDETQNSEYAFELSTVGADNYGIADRVLPGTSSDLVQVTIEAKHLGGDGKLTFTNPPSASTGDHGSAVGSEVRSTDTGWQSRRFVMPGGSRLRLRIAVGEAKVAVDNLSMKYVTEIDMAPINALWIDHVADMMALEQAWEDRKDNDGIAMPIGAAAFRSNRIPEYNHVPPEPDDPDLI